MLINRISGLINGELRGVREGEEIVLHTNVPALVLPYRNWAMVISGAQETARFYFTYLLFLRKGYYNIKKCLQSYLIRFRVTIYGKAIRNE